MTEEQQKEMLSKEYIRILAYGHGFKVLEPSPDNGVDMLLYPVTIVETPQGRLRYLDSPHKLELQLKATTPMSIIDDADNIKYDLDVKNYNDLVHRRTDLIPLHLVLVVLREAPPGCLEWSIEKLALLGCAYWYLPDENAEISPNDRTVRITIPKSNHLTLGFVRERFEEFGLEV